MYDLATCRARRRLARARASDDLAFRRDGAQIAVIYPEETTLLPDHWRRNQESLSGRFCYRPRGECVAWSPDGVTLATPCDDRKIYLWDAATGIRRATLEGCTNIGLRGAFHPAGTLLASNGWEGRLRLWDPVMGRPVLSLTSDRWPEFSKEGRSSSFEERLTAYQVNPALEYRTFAHASGEPIHYRSAAIHRDGRLLAVATSRGVAMWDLAHGTEIAFLPIGDVLQVMFESSGDLLTSGAIGVRRWPVRINLDRQGVRIGPPHSTPVAGSRLCHGRGPHGPHHGVGRP